MIIVRKDDDKRLEKRETISRGETSARDKEHRDKERDKDKLSDLRYMEKIPSESKEWKGFII